MFRANGELSIAPRVNWYRVDKQLESAAAMAKLDLRIILPGHARRGHFADQAAKDAVFNDLLARNGN